MYDFRRLVARPERRAAFDAGAIVLMESASRTVAVALAGVAAGPAGIHFRHNSFRLSDGRHQSVLFESFPNRLDSNPTRFAHVIHRIHVYRVCSVPFSSFFFPRLTLVHVGSGQFGQTRRPCRKKNVGERKKQSSLGKELTLVILTMATHFTR